VVRREETDMTAKDARTKLKSLASPEAAALVTRFEFVGTLPAK
jgi:hypothetical protein